MDVNQIAKEKGYVKAGDSLVNLLAMPVANKGMVNTLRVSVIKDWLKGQLELSFHFFLCWGFFEITQGNP